MPWCCLFRCLLAASRRLPTYLPCCVFYLSAIGAGDGYLLPLAPFDAARREC